MSDQDRQTQIEGWVPAIAEGIWQRAQEIPAGVVWNDPWRPARADGKPTRTGHHLFAGGGGIALFYAARAFLGHAEDRQRAKLALGPVRRTVRALAANPQRAAQLPLQIGAFEGIGSLIYVLTVAAELLDDENILSDAFLAVSLLTEEKIRGDLDFDLTHGAAGALMALLRLGESLENRSDSSRAEDCRSAARICVSHLLDARHADAWLWKGKSALCGMSHGAAGIGHALLAWHSAQPSDDVLAAVSNAWRWESSGFDQDRREWRDFRDPSPRFTSTWCHGSPGIALTRLSAADLFGDLDSAAEDLERALESTARQEPDGVDHLCCGTFGRAEVLYAGARRLERPELGLRADSLTTQALERAADVTGLVWSAEPGSPDFVPGFLPGAAGVGYFLLRRLHPGRLPNVLSLEGMPTG